MAGRKGDQGSKEKIAKGMEEAGRGEVGKAGGEAGKGERDHRHDPEATERRLGGGHARDGA